ncbi:MAG: Bug family tripartite tricarboxylate transporter substrate binding protein [Gammaproteobacteria bacterium]
MSRIDRRDFLTSASLGLSALAFGSAHAQEASFAGELVELIIPFKEGGGSDTWGRFNAPFFSRFLPGQPTVVVRNVPGGNSIAGANRFASRARPDGLSVLGTSASTQFPYLMADPRVDYDYAEWRVVMAYGTGGVAYVSSELGVESIADLANVMDRELLYGSQGPTSLDLVPVLGFKLLGLNVRPIFGMSGRGAGRLAFERGELNLDYQTSTAYLRNVVPLIEQGDAVPLFSWGALDDDGNLIRDPTFPDLPHYGEAYEMLHGRQPSGISWDSWFAFFTAGFPAQKLFVVPRETPDEIVNAYADAVNAMKRDADYIARKPAALGVYEQVTGAAAQRIYELATDVPQSARDWVRQWLMDEFRVNLEN